MRQGVGGRRKGKKKRRKREEEKRKAKTKKRQTHAPRQCYTPLATMDSGPRDGEAMQCDQSTPSSDRRISGSISQYQRIGEGQASVCLSPKSKRPRFCTAVLFWEARPRPPEPAPGPAWRPAAPAGGVSRFAHRLVCLYCVIMSFWASPRGHGSALLLAPSQCNSPSILPRQQQRAPASVPSSGHLACLVHVATRQDWAWPGRSLRGILRGRLAANSHHVDSMQGSGRSKASFRLRGADTTLFWDAGGGGCTAQKAERAWCVERLGRLRLPNVPCGPSPVNGLWPCPDCRPLLGSSWPRNILPIGACLRAACRMG